MDVIEAVALYIEEAKHVCGGSIALPSTEMRVDSTPDESGQ